MAEFWKRVAYRFRSDGPLRFAGRAIKHVWSNPLAIVEPLYQVLKPSSTTLHLDGVECEFTLAPGRISTRDFRGAFESEKRIVRSLVQNLSSDDVFWDIGANVGVYTCFASTVIDDGGSIVAFEPHPGIRNHLESNVERNTSNARIVPYGLADEENTEQLSEIGLAAHTIAETAEHDTVKIELITARQAVDDLDLPRPSVVKMDIEGAELAALEGFGDLINDVRLLFCEVHPKRLDQMEASGEEVERYLADVGFDVERVGDRGGTYFLRCRRSRG